MSISVIADTADLESATYRKIGWRLMPYLFALYVVAFLDRVNVSYARLQMSADLGFSETVYGLAAGMFFVGYFFFEVPSNLLLERVGARMWIARILIVWGIISSAFMFVETPTQFYVMRFLLGVGEAGFFPGIILYLTYWFPAQRRAHMVAIFMSAIAVSGVIGGPLSGWIMKALAGASGLAGWQWLFLLEGLPAVILGIMTIRYLDDGPSQAKWLTRQQKELVLRRLEEDTELKNVSGGHSRFLASIQDRRVWLLALVYFSNTIAFFGVGFFLPQLVKELGIVDVFYVGLVSAIPWTVGAVTMLLVGRHSDRTLERRWHVAVPGLLAGVGLAVAAFSGISSMLVGMIALTIATAGALCVYPVFWALPTSFLSGGAAAGGIALINSFGALGGFFGPYLVGVVRDLTGSSQIALYVLAGFFFLIAPLVVGGFKPEPLRAGSFHS